MKTDFVLSLSHYCGCFWDVKISFLIFWRGKNDQPSKSSWSFFLFKCFCLFWQFWVISSSNICWIQFFCWITHCFLEHNSATSCDVDVPDLSNYCYWASWCWKFKKTFTKNRKLAGMHNVGFFADILYADILQLIWPLINAHRYGIYVYMFSLHLIAEIISSVVEFTYSIIMQTLTFVACWQMQA